MTLNDFERDIYAVARESLICDIPTIRRLTASAINMRVAILSDLFATPCFVDAFYNEATGTTAFALLSDKNRIFGADNTGGWHTHPFADPKQHVPTAQPVPFAECILEIERHIAAA